MISEKKKYRVQARVYLFGRSWDCEHLEASITSKAGLVLLFPLPPPSPPPLCPPPRRRCPQRRPPQMASHSHPSSTANIVGVHYRVGRKIGEGSFGVIFEGTNLLNNQQVAIKFVRVLPYPVLPSSAYIGCHASRLPMLTNLNHRSLARVMRPN